MNVPVTLALSGKQHAELRDFLFPHDGKEAVAHLLCARRAGLCRHRLVVREIHPIPYDKCSKRTRTLVTWAPEDIIPLLERATEESLSVVKVHSHPNGYSDFSGIDDKGDNLLLPIIRDWVEADVPHGSAVMLPGGKIFGRVLWHDTTFEPIDCVSVAGDDLHFWYADFKTGDVPNFLASHAPVFDEGTIQRMRRLSIAVVGASGSGSPVIEQLMRLGVGEIVIVDPDCVEERNINRILNSTRSDAEQRRAKVEVLKESIYRAGLGTRVIPIAKSLWDREVVCRVAQCDVVFGCMDSIDGRYLLNTLATCYNLPYFDIGIRLERMMREYGEGCEICGTVHYLQPGGSSLMSRGLITMEQVAAAGMRRENPNMHDQQVKEGYITGVEEHRPAVISINMFAASLAVTEFLARLHPFREESNRCSVSVEFSLASMELYSNMEEGVCKILAGKVGKGDEEPLLGLPQLSIAPGEKKNV